MTERNPRLGKGEVMERLRDIALNHQRRDEDCSDHYIETCTCGANRNRSVMSDKRAEQGDTEVDPHSWDWDEHYKQVWDEAIRDLT